MIGTHRLHSLSLSLSLFLSALLCPAVASAQSGGGGDVTITTSSSSSVGTTDATFVSLQETIGPADIVVGDWGACQVSRPLDPNTPGCHSIGGSGTAGDPYWGICLANCTGAGTPFHVASGAININEHTHTQIARAGDATPAPVPLGPWVPVGAALGIALTALAWLRRREP